MSSRLSSGTPARHYRRHTVAVIAYALMLLLLAAAASAMLLAAATYAMLMLCLCCYASGAIYAAVMPFALCDYIFL